MPTLQETLQGLTPEQKTLLRQRLTEEVQRRQQQPKGIFNQAARGVSNIATGIGGIAQRGIRAGLEALPSIALGQVPPAQPTGDLGEFETPEDKIKKVGRFDPVTGEVTTVETDADKILRGAIEKPEKDLTPTDLINLTKILTMEPPPRPGAVLGLGERPGIEFTPEQQQLREQAQALLDRNAARLQIGEELTTSQTEKKEAEKILKDAGQPISDANVAEVIRQLREAR